MRLRWPKEQVEQPKQTVSMNEQMLQLAFRMCQSSTGGNAPASLPLGNVPLSRSPSCPPLAIEDAKSGSGSSRSLSQQPLAIEDAKSVPGSGSEP